MSVLIPLNKGTVHRGGGFRTAEDAARARDALALELNGEFAVLNFGRSA